jgi:hypothetical protein
MVLARTVTVTVSESVTLTPVVRLVPVIVTAFVNVPEASEAMRTTSVIVFESPGQA